MNLFQINMILKRPKINLFEKFDITRGQFVDLKGASCSWMITQNHKLGAIRNPFAVKKSIIQRLLSVQNDLRFIHYFLFSRIIPIDQL